MYLHQIYDIESLSMSKHFLRTRIQLFKFNSTRSMSASIPKILRQDVDWGHRATIYSKVKARNLGPSSSNGTQPMMNISMLYGISGWSDSIHMDNFLGIFHLHLLERSPEYFLEKRKALYLSQGPKKFGKFSGNWDLDTQMDIYPRNIQ